MCWRNLLLLQVTLVLLVGCATSNPITRISESITARSEHHQQMAEERAKLHEMQTEIELACRAQRQREKLERFEQACGRTIPELEADLGMRMRQRFEIGEPELDVSEAKGMIDDLVRDYEYRMKIYRDSLAQWEINRDQFYKTRQPTLDTVNGCGCDRVETQYSVPKPVKPTLTVAAAQIPMKMNVRIGTKLDNGRFDNFRSRQVLVPPSCSGCCSQQAGCDCLACRGEAVPAQNPASYPTDAVPTQQAFANLGLPPQGGQQAAYELSANDLVVPEAGYQLAPEHNYRVSSIPTVPASQVNWSAK